MTRPFDRLRTAITNLATDEKRALARSLGINREALEDFTDINIALDPDMMSKLESWHELRSLRAALTDRSRLQQLADICLATGVAPLDYVAFLDGSTDLSPTQRGLLRSFLMGEWGITAAGNWIRSPKAGPPTPAATTSASLPPDMLRRTSLIMLLRNLPLVELETIVASLPQKAT